MKTNIRTKNHNWSKSDYIVTFFITKYGTNGIYLNNETNISKFIGTSVESLKMMESNFRHLLGVPNQLGDTKPLQQRVYDEYNKKPFIEFWKEVKDIIRHDETTRDIFVSEKLGRKNYRFIGSRMV